MSENKYQIAILCEEENYGLSGITTTALFDNKHRAEEYLKRLVTSKLKDGAGGEADYCTELMCTLRCVGGKKYTYFLQVVYPIGRSESEEFSEDLSYWLTEEGFEITE